MQNESLSKFVSKRIAELRKEQDMSQAELSSRAGIGDKQITKYEAHPDEVNMTLDTLARIIRALDVDFYYFFKNRYNELADVISDLKPDQKDRIVDLANSYTTINEEDPPYDKETSEDK